MNDWMIEVCILQAKFKQNLYYLLPQSMQEEISTCYQTQLFSPEFCRNRLVQVPLGKNNKLQAALILRTCPLPQTFAKEKLKFAAAWYNERAYLSDKQVELAHLLAQRYQCTFAHALSLSLPPYNLKQPEKSGNKYRNYIALIQQSLTEAERSKLAAVPQLTTEQKAVLQKLQLSLAANKREFLLHGVTGSGKTEIYLTLAKEVLAAGHCCLILVPEINLSYPMIQAFSLRFPEICGIWHSQMSEGEKLSTAMAIADGKLKILIGTRSALFSNLDNIGLIVIDEEHDSSYLSETIPHYHAITVARLMLRQHPKAFLLLASATPSVNSYYRTTEGRSVLLTLTQRVTHTLPPAIDIVDLRNETVKTDKLILAKRTVKTISNCLNLQQQVLLVLNRRGYNTSTLCRKCGRAILCPHCDFRLVYHLDCRKLLCHYCGYRRNLPEKCAFCGEKALINYGFGTEMVEQYVRNLFPQVNVARLDQDVSSKKQAATKVLQDFRQGRCQILVGTQMIAKGHDFSNVGLVCLLCIDSLLSMPGYKAEERCFQLICQAAGRAGRQGQNCQVLLQTFAPQERCLQAAIRNDYQQFYQDQLVWRRRLGYPPFLYFGQFKISINCRYDLSAIRALLQRINAELTALIAGIKQHKPELQLILWPFSDDLLRKVDNEYRIFLNITANDEAAISYLFKLLLQISLPFTCNFSLFLEA